MKKLIKNKRMTIIWSICLLVLSGVTLFLAGVKITGIEIPDILIRVLGVVELITLPIFAFVSVRLFTKKN